MGKMLLGISGGHTRSVAVAYNVDERHLYGWYEGDALNLHRLHARDVGGRLELLLQKMAPDLPFGTLKQEAFLCIALPGAGRERDAMEAAQRMEYAGWKNDRYLILDDTWAALYEVCKNEPGICAFAGSGASVCYSDGSFTQAGMHKIDGWGPIVGDFGSAFELVRIFFRKIRRSLDREPASYPRLLADIVAGPYGLGGPTEIQNWVDRLLRSKPTDWPAAFALLAKTICARADEGDKEASELVSLAAAEMIESISIVIKRFTAFEVPIVLQGGMFRECKVYREEVTSALRGLHAGEVVLSRGGPAVGALLYALKDDPASAEVVQNSLDQLRPA